MGHKINLTYIFLWAAKQYSAWYFGKSLISPTNKISLWKCKTSITNKRYDKLNKLHLHLMVVGVCKKK